MSDPSNERKAKRWTFIREAVAKQKLVGAKDLAEAIRIEDRKKLLSQCADILVYADNRTRRKKKGPASALSTMKTTMLPTSGAIPVKDAEPRISRTNTDGQFGGSTAATVADFFNQHETTCLTNAIIHQTEFLKFAPAPLKRRLVHSMRLKRVKPQECILKRGEFLSGITFLLQGQIGVYYDTPATPKGESCDRDEYGDAMPESGKRIRVITPFAVIEEKSALFDVETKFAYAGVSTPPSQLGSAISAHISAVTHSIICAHLPICEPAIRDILARLVDGYSDRMLFVHKHFPSAHRCREDTKTILANSCTEESFSQKSSLSKLMERVNEKAILALLSCGVVICGPYEHPNMELQPGAIIGVQSRMSTRGGVWAKCPVTVLTWSWSQVLSAEAKAKADDARASAASFGAHAKIPPSVKKASPPSITQIITSFSLDHLRSVGGDTLQARLDRFEAAKAKPKNSTVSHVWAPSKWCKLQKLMDRSDGLKTPIRSELVFPVSRSPPKQSDKLLLGPRSFALKNAEALLKKERFSSTPALAMGQRPMTSEGKRNATLCESSPILEIALPGSRPQTAHPVSKVQTIARPLIAIPRRSKPNGRPHSVQ
eukprot:GEMP01005680.1.p1 GENE.GEMP01005680.1~~GEMP01005680.1.p1  ORF type:complete len:601 (+),score=111.43 GEMP01005680.1:200-2002(+)